MENPQVSTITELVVFGCIGMIALIVFIFIFIIMYQRKVNLHKLRINEKENQHQKQLLESTIIIEESERERIAKNLHDSVNPMLTLLKLNLTKHRMAFAKNTFSPEEYKKDVVLIDHAIENIRSTCSDLLPSFLLEFGLIKTLEEYIKKIGSDLIQVKITNDLNSDIPDQLKKQQQLLIYRVFLELMNNLLKHSGFNQINLLLKEEGANLILQIFHNGKGITNEEIEKLTEASKGLGLRSLKARVLLLNGNIDYQKNETLSSIKLSIPVKV